MFKIEINISENRNERDDEETTSAIDAIETIYHKEDIVIFKWGEIDFSALIVGDISDSWRDIIKLSQDLKSNLKEISIQFPSQTFWQYWTFKETEESSWEVEVFWSADKQKKIKVKKERFQKEIQKLITLIESDLIKQGYDLFKFQEYLHIRKNDEDKILAWKKYPKPLGGNYYAHSLEEEFNVRVLFDFCRSDEAVIYAEGWNFLLSQFGLKRLFEIDQASGWLNPTSKEKWLESLFYKVLSSGMNLETGSYGVYNQATNTFKTKEGKIENIDWEKIKRKKIF